MNAVHIGEDVIFASVNYLLCLLIGYGAGAFSAWFPGMLNMTAVSVSLDHGRRAGYQYALGAGITAFGQALLALTFADYIAQHPAVIEWCKRIALFVFPALAIIFFLKARRPSIEAKPLRGGPLTFGILLAAMNALTIPYYFSLGTFLEADQYLELTPLSILLFALAAGSGAATFFALYARSADFISLRAGFLARNMNYVLSGLFVVLTLVQLVVE